MADTTTATENAAKAAGSAATKAAEKTAEKTAAKVADLAAEKAALKFAEQFGEQFVGGALPIVAETTELALEIPSKIVLNQKLVFTVGVLSGVALGAGILFGVNKFIHRKKAKHSVVDSVVVENETSTTA